MILPLPPSPSLQTHSLLTILAFADLLAVLAISVRRTLLVAGLAPPAWRTGAGASDGVTAGRVVAGTAVATGRAPPPRGAGDRAGPAPVTS